MVEKVEKIVITQSPTPTASASDGQRYARQRRRRKTSVSDDHLGEQDQAR